MNNETINKIIEDSYDESKEDGLRSMVRDFYSRKLLSSAIAGWVGGLVFTGLAIFGAVELFKTDQIQRQLMYAALFIVGMHGIFMMKIFSWQMVHRLGIKRDIKRLELRVAELSEALNGK
jgi:hypothetical protein